MTMNNPTSFTFDDLVKAKQKLDALRPVVKYIVSPHVPTKDIDGDEVLCYSVELIGYRSVLVVHPDSLAKLKQEAPWLNYQPMNEDDWDEYARYSLVDLNGSIDLPQRDKWEALGLAKKSKEVDEEEKEGG